jgi:hypothetical protein
MECAAFFATVGRYGTNGGRIVQLCASGQVCIDPDHIVHRRAINLLATADVIE